MGKSILEVLRAEYDTFTLSEKKIADYILQNQSECMGIGITEMAAVCGVAVSTVSVFCRKLKLAGFNDFKMELARADLLTRTRLDSEMDGEVRQGDGAEDVMKKIHLRGQTVLDLSAQMLDPQAVEQAVELMDRAARVLLLGQGNHSSVASVAWTQFAMASSKFQIVHDSHMQTVAIANLSPGDVVLYFTYTGATLEVMAAAETIRQVGAKLILVTRFQRSPAAEYADVVLITGADEKPLQFGSVDAVSSQLYVVDVLLSCYCLRHTQEVARQREFIGKELAKKHL